MDNPCKFDGRAGLGQSHEANTHRLVVPVSSEQHGRVIPGRVRVDALRGAQHVPECLRCPCAALLLLRCAVCRPADQLVEVQAPTREAQQPQVCGGATVASRT